MIGYLANELNQDNQTADKTVKKARGGVASRKAKTSSMVAHAARLKKQENQDPNQTYEEESHNKPSSRTGDLSFVLNAPDHPRSKPHSGKTLPSQKPSSQPPAPSFVESGSSFASGEPAHNRKINSFSGINNSSFKDEEAKG